MSDDDRDSRQLTLTGTEVRTDREPSTSLRWCEECGGWLLASYALSEHRHTVYESPEIAELERGENHEFG